MNQNLHYIKRKSFILYLLVNFVTCGFYNYFLSYQFANELSNENPERRTINPIGLMFITIIPVVGPIIWISQITSRMKYTVQKYALPISLRTGVIKMLYIIGQIGAPIFLVVASTTLIIWQSDDTIADIFLYVSIACSVLGFVGLVGVFVAMILLFGQYNKLANALNYVPGANMPQMDMYNQPMNNQFVQQPVQQPMHQPMVEPQQPVNMQPQMEVPAQPQMVQQPMQPEVSAPMQTTENNQQQDN